MGRKGLPPALRSREFKKGSAIKVTPGAVVHIHVHNTKPAAPKTTTAAKKKPAGPKVPKIQPGGNPFGGGGFTPGGGMPPTGGWSPGGGM